MKPIVWFWLGVMVAVFAVTYWWLSASQLEQKKSAIMAKQRAVSKSLGPKLLPFVERVETWTTELSTAPSTSFVPPQIESGLKWEQLARLPGVYLRILQSKGGSQDTIRRAASISLNDGFTSCFFVREGAPDPTQGPNCRTSSDCATGLLCNEWDVCSNVPRPFNMRLAYRAFRSLSSDFTRDLQDATDELQVRALERELEQISRVDVPVAIEVLLRAKTVTVVVDETPGNAASPSSAADTTGVALTEEQRVQGSVHNARVGIWDATSGKPIVRWRGAASGRMLAVGRAIHLDAELAGARQRQSNSCALATALRSQIMNQEAQN